MEASGARPFFFLRGIELEKETSVHGDVKEHVLLRFPGELESHFIRIGVATSTAQLWMPISGGLQIHTRVLGPLLGRIILWCICVPNSSCLSFPSGSSVWVIRAMT